MFASVIKSISTFEYMQAALFENIFEKKNIYCQDKSSWVKVQNFKNPELSKFKF